MDEKDVEAAVMVPKAQVLESLRGRTYDYYENEQGKCKIVVRDYEAEARASFA